MNTREGDHSLYLPQKVAQIASLLAILILTLFVGLCSAFIVYITYAHFNTQKGWTVCAMSVLSASALVGCCWHRIFVEKPPVMLPLQEQPEGVWPPAPVVTTERNNP